MDNNTWIKLNRSIQDHWLYEDKPFNKTMAWIDLILIADYKTQKKMWRGNQVTFKRGDVNKSISALAVRWGWSRGRVKRFLKMLETDNMIKINATTNRTTITLINYGVFQDKRSTDKSTVDTTEQTSDGTTGGTHLKNIKKDKENKKGASSLPEEAPAPEEEEEEITDEMFEAMEDI